MHLRDKMNTKEMRKAQGNGEMIMPSVISSATTPQLLSCD